MPTFSFPDEDDTLPPSTPDRNPRYGSGKFNFGDNPSTTPAGPPPPSSAASFTPAGAPSDSYLGSSMMRGVTEQKSMPFGAAPAGGASKFTKNLFGSGIDSSPQQPLGRSIAPSRTSRQPSALSREYSTAGSTRSRQANTFHISSDEEDEEDEEEEVDEAADMDEQMKRFIEQDIDENEEEEEEDEEEHDAEGDDDIFLNMSHRPDDEEDDYEEEEDDEEDGEGEYDEEEEEEGEEGSEAVDGTDLMELVTPAANERARKEAESIFRVSTFRRSAGRREFRYAPVARNLHTSLGFAVVDEAPKLIVETESWIKRMYDEGIGKEDDPEQLDITLANVAQPLCELWRDYADSLPLPEGEVKAEVGPAEEDEPFRKAFFIANLVLQLNHARIFERGQVEPRPLPGVLFQWAQESSSVYLAQVGDVLYHQPSPACHSLFWQTVSAAQLRGDLRAVLRLLRGAGWENIRKGPRGGFAYEGRALENVRRAAGLTCDMLESCPGRQKHDADPGDWEIVNSDWTLFRIQARGSFDKLQRFAEGKDRSALIGTGDDIQDKASLARMARKAESQVPWDIYEHLQGIYEIALGVPETILEIAQDWCEATVGLFGWWEMGRNNNQRSLRMSTSRSLALPAPFPGGEGYFDRLQLAFHTVIDSGFHFNAMNPVEVAVASAFEGNSTAVIGFLRAWSLPVAAAVADLASLGQWLPKPDGPNLITLGSLDMEDLDMLGVAPQSKDDTEGIKDTTIVEYARGLAGIETLPGGREGWELAIEVLGRMDSAARSEDMVGELLQDILESLTVDSSNTVDKVWRMLQNLGMIQYAEETAETFADQLQDKTHRYGEALWYYALAHRPAKARDVLNLLTSMSLVHSAPYPATNDLDDHLHRLLTQRGRTLEQLAKQDLEAAQLLGRMLSGYATLRKFYDIRDSEGFTNFSTTKSTKLRSEAIGALSAVIASSDDNIRGGLYDPTRDAVVSEDFILALLGEALPFVSQGPSSPVVVTLDQMDILLKATEDIETVSSNVFNGPNSFFETVLGAAPGLKGSSPHDLMRKNSGAESSSGSWVMTGSSMFASQMQRSLGNVKTNTKRGWDWRSGLTSNTTSKDVLRILRLNLTRELSKLWIAEADNELAF